MSSDARMDQYVKLLDRARENLRRDIFASFIASKTASNPKREQLELWKKLGQRDPKFRAGRPEHQLCLDRINALPDFAVYDSSRGKPYGGFSGATHITIATTLSPETMLCRVLPLLNVRRVGAVGHCLPVLKTGRLLMYKMVGGNFRWDASWVWTFAQLVGVLEYAQELFGSVDKSRALTSQRPPQ